MFTSILNTYTRFILRVDPPKWWIFLRFLIHWVTIPIKLFVIGGLGIYQIIKHSFDKPRSIETKDIDSVKKDYFEKILNLSPIMQTYDLHLYVNRNPYYEPVDGTRHNPDHQLARHSTFSFIMHKLGLRTHQMDTALWMHLQGKLLARGYKWNALNDNMIEFNVGTTSGDMLCGLNLAMLDTDNDALIERFDILVNHIIDNDYSLLEGLRPDNEDPGQLLWDQLLAANAQRPEKVIMKSARGMWQPGLETVGAQALTILSALRVADKMGVINAKKAYRKLLFQYGYGLLAIFPTAYVDSQRGYFNDHNCIISLYVLSRLSDSRLGKLFWKLPMVYTWALSKHWYNGYFTGLVNEQYPVTIKESYLEKCRQYLYEEEPNAFNYSTTAVQASESPVKLNEIHEDEFSADCVRNTKISNPEESKKVRTGLGFLAAAVMLEPNPRNLLKK